MCQVKKRKKMFERCPVEITVQFILNCFDKIWDCEIKNYFSSFCEFSEPLQLRYFPNV